MSPLPGLSSSFQEPSTPDTTSTPPETSPSTPAGQNVSQILGQRKKKPFGPTVRSPGALAGAIARSKRARQTGDKWGA